MSSMHTDGFSNGTGTAARALVVNRTRRVIREEAVKLQEQKQQTRSLWVPLGICSVLLAVIFYAVWGMLDGYDLTPSGVPDASDQLALMLLWSLPVTAILLGLVWFRRERSRANDEVPQ